MFSFKSKSIIILVITTFILLITFYVTLININNHKLTLLENKEIIEGTDRVLANVNKRMLARLDGIVKNYGTWNPTYDFAENRNLAYKRENFNEKFFENNSISFVGMYNTEGKLILWKSNNEEVELNIHKEITNYVLNNSTTINGKTGFISLSTFPYIIAASNIVKSNGSGVSKGIVIMGRKITDDILLELSSMENVQVKLENYHYQPAVQDKYSIFKKNDEIYTKSTIHDIDGHPKFTMIVSEKRDIINKTANDFMVILLIFILLCSLYAVCLFYLFKKFILNKISYISNEVKEISKTKKLSKIHYSGSDEVALLTKEINHMLKRIEDKDIEKKQDDELYRSILQTMSDGLVVYDSSARCILANINASRITELEENDLLHKLTTRQYPWELLNEDGKPLRELPATKALKHKKPTLNQIIGLKFSEDKIKWLATNTVPITKNEGSKLDGAILTFRDVTELQESRSKLSASNVLINSLINNLNSGILYVDNNGIIQLLNERLTQLLGPEFTSKNMIGTDDYPHRIKLSKSLKNEDEFNKRIDEIIAKSIPVVGEVLHMKDGRVILMDHVPIIVEGNYKGDLWQFTDVTDKLNIEKSLLLAKEEAERANKVKTEFISKVSHELRTPLNGIIGFAQLLLLDNMHPLDKKQKENVHEILQAGRMLTNLINDMLDVSQIDVGKLRVKFEELRVSKVVHESVKMMVPTANDKEITIETNLEDADNIFILGDQVRITQVFNNLISNAIKYNKVKGKIEISYECKNNKVSINFKDTGIGIPESKLQSIFDPFTRIEQGKEGMGIGLYLVKQLTEQMNGIVHVESELGKGSTFTLVFPIERARIIKKQSDNIDTIDRVNFSPSDVLYVEDNEANIKVLSNYFKEFPKVTLHVERLGLNGIYKANKLMPDVILLDLSLPDISGLDVLKSIKSSQKTKDIPVIIITAQNINEELYEKLMKLGCAEILSKPLQFNKLLNVIKNYIETKKP